MREYQILSYALACLRCGRGWRKGAGEAHLCGSPTPGLISRRRRSALAPARVATPVRHSRSLSRWARRAC